MAIRTVDSSDHGADLVERATPPASQPPWVMVASWLMRLVLLACAGVVMQVGWVLVWMLSYHLTHGNTFTYEYLVDQSAVWEKLRDVLLLANTLGPGLEPLDGAPDFNMLVYALILAFVLAGVGYLAGILLLDFGVSSVPGALTVIVVFELIFQVTLFLIPGLYTTDIFSYVMYGQISAIYNLNPYTYPPNYFPNHELMNGNWIHPIWFDAPSVYGPLWTNIGWVFARVIAPLTLTYQVFAYKLLLNGVHLVNLVLVWVLLLRLMPNRPRARLTAFTVFAWNPVMLFDGPGNAHNDILMVTLLLLGVMPLAFSSRARPSNRAWLSGTFFVGMSALIKYTTGLVGLFYLVPWARQLRSWPGRIAWIGGSGALVVGVTLLLFWPWLDFPRALEPILTAANGKSWQYSNSGPDIIALQIDNKLLHEPTPDITTENHEYLYADLYATSTSASTRQTMKNVTRVIFAIYLLWECWGLWRLAGNRSTAILQPVLKSSVRAFVVLIVLVLPWVLDWYWMWPLALASLLGWRSMLTKVVVAYTLVCLPLFYLHHYWSWNMPSSLVFVYVLLPLTVPAIAWVYQRFAGEGRPRVQMASALRAPGVGAE
jgi:alpha-1,6-mannosyltransferase